MCIIMTFNIYCYSKQIYYVTRLVRKSLLALFESTAQTSLMKDTLVLHVEKSHCATFSFSRTSRSCFHWATAALSVGKSNAKGTGEKPSQGVSHYATVENLSDKLEHIVCKDAEKLSIVIDFPIAQ